MNYLWAGMMLVAIVYGAFYGTIPEVTQAARCAWARRRSPASTAAARWI